MRGDRAVAVVAVIIALVASGCGLERSLPLEIVTRDFAFEGVPQTITGGPVSVTLRNVGKVAHEIAFIDIGDTSLDTFKKDFPAVFQGQAFPSYFKTGVVPLETEPGKTVNSTFTLPEGNYLLFCALDGDPTKPKTPEGDEASGKPHYELGMVGNVSVEGGGGEVSAPDGEVVAKDYSFELPQLKAGKNSLVFRNDGPKQWHFADIQVFPAGVTEQQAADAFGKLLQGGEDAPPPPGVPLPEEHAFFGVFSPGNGGTYELTLEPGRTYLMACFIQDLAGGPPHAVKYKMFKAFTVG
jgi:plastocyanin